ncbi:MAG TPA: glycosyltransferase family 39 protein [Solirubrobacteraceae bacterium]|nr:glycosyltransferase family 39 protein [Solirubrobacteraceae bacterium]
MERRTWLVAAAIVLLALAVRVWEVERTNPYHPINDARSYLALASQVAHRGDYLNSDAPRSGAGGSIGPTAYFPPAYPYLLAGVDLLDGHPSGGSQALEDVRLATAALGAVSVAVLGLVAFEAFGPAVALVAMLIAAVYPPLVVFSGTPYSENLLIALELAAVWAGLRSQRAANPWPLLALSGVFAGLATLAHQNGVVIVLPLIFCALQSVRRWSASRPEGSRAVSTRRPALTAVVGPVVLLACAALTIAPWTIRNAVVLHRFVPVSDEMGITLAGTYNSSSANDRQIPYRWKYYGNIPGFASTARASLHLTEPELSSRLTSAALHYIGQHPLSPAQAAYHNLRRLLELEGSFAWRASAYDIGLDGGTMKVAVYSFWLVALLAAAGLFTRRARRAPPWLWGVPILLTLSVILVNAQTPRFRSPIDPYLIMLAACTVVSAAASLLSRRATRPE